MAAATRQSHNCDDSLDVEYLQILRRIKPFITCIMNNYYIELIRVWLEKLSDVNLEDKKLRNVYLTELGKQIETEVFQEPFINPPPDGILPPFQDSWPKHDSEKDLTDESTKKTRPYATNEENSKRVFDPNLSQFELSQNTYTMAGNSCYSLPESDLVDIKEPDAKFFAVPSVDAAPKKKQKPKFSQLNMDLNEKLKLVDNFSKNICNSLRTAKRKKPKFKKQHNVYTVAHEEYEDAMPPDLPEYSERSFYDPVTRQEDVSVYPRSRSEVKKSKQRKVRHKRPHRKSRDSDDSSWYDLTEVSTVTGFGSGDTALEANEAVEMQDMYETKIADLLNIIDELKKENVILNQHVDQYEKDLSLRNTKAETSLHNLASEVECLKSRLQELVDIKMSLQSSHFAVTTEWQNTITTLHKRLNLLQRKNNELKMQNNELERKVSEAEVERKKDLMTQKKKLAELHAKETDMLKQIHARATTDIETKYGLRMEEQEEEFVKKLDELKETHEMRLNGIREEYENRVANIKHEHENRINCVGADYDKMLNDKDVEIERLENLLQEQCLRMQEEVQLIRCQVECNAHTTSENYIDKIAFLQKCVLKMERLFQKSEKENSKQLLKLRRELEYRDKTSQLALTSQRADLMSNTLNGRQTEIDVVVAQLEEHYKKMLTQQQQRYVEDRKHDTRIITELKDQLSKYRAEL